MNFNQVKAITIPEGSVKSITDSLGRILWKKASSSIVLWEGDWSASNSNISPDLTLTLPDSGAVKLRITFSDIFENNADKNLYRPCKIKLPDGYTGNKLNDEKVIDFDVPESYDNNLVTTFYTNSMFDSYVRMKLTKNGNSITIKGTTSGTNTNFVIRMTKIEIVTDNTTIETRLYKDESTINGIDNLSSTILQVYAGSQGSATSTNENGYVPISSMIIGGVNANITSENPNTNLGFIYRFVSTDSVIRFKVNLADSSYHFKVYLNGTLVSDNTGSTTNYYNYNVTKNTDLHYYVNGNVTGPGNVELYLVES